MKTIPPSSEVLDRGGETTGSAAPTACPSPKLTEQSELELKLKTEHQFVLRALKVSNLASRRVVTNPEIVQALSESELTQLKATYQQNIGTVVGKILTLLQARGLVFSPGKIGQIRYYGAVSVLDAERAVLPDKQTRRGRTIELVRGAVAAFGRAVRIGDIFTYAKGRTEVCDLDLTSISHDVLSLAETKDLRVVGIVRGEGKGHNLYLPSEMDPASHIPQKPLTWIEEVAQAFSEVWAVHLQQAKDENRLPRPISTGEVRAKWSTTPGAHAKSSERQPVVDAMQILALKSREQPPLVRKIKRKGEKANLWAPVDTPSQELDLGHAHATDTERVGVAVRRSVKHLGRPVTVRDVSDEIELDPSLRPAKTQSLFSILSDISKEKADVVGGKPQKRGIRRVYRVGMVENEVYYYHRRDGLSEAESYIDFLRLEIQWDWLRFGERIEALNNCYLPSAAIGQALLIGTEVEDMRGKLDAFLGRKMDWSTRREAEVLHRRASEILADSRQWLDGHNQSTFALPQEVSRDVQCWTSHKLFEVLYPLYPVLRKNNDPTQVIALLYDQVRRVKNPHYINRFSKEPLEAAEFLFDRTDALLYAAQKWGGNECKFLARTARTELFWLRDERFILPALKAEDMKARLAAVSCLAFLWSDEAKTQLRQVAVEDLEPGVRQSALWGYGFAGGDMKDLLQERSEKDNNAHVRAFAKKAMTLDERGWWAF